MLIWIKMCKTKWVQIPERWKPVTGKPTTPVSVSWTEYKNKQQKLRQMGNTRCFTMFTTNIVTQVQQSLHLSVCMVAFLLDSPNKLTQGFLNSRHRWEKWTPCRASREALAQNLFLPPMQLRSMTHSQKNQKCTVFKCSTLGSQAAGEPGWFWFTVQAHPQEAHRSCPQSISVKWTAIKRFWES